MLPGKAGAPCAQTDPLLLMHRAAQLNARPRTPAGPPAKVVLGQVRFGLSRVKSHSPPYSGSCRWRKLVTNTFYT